MNTKQIDYCIELARTLNFSRAAENLFVSQPTFSYQIRLLEEEVGFAIFERSGRGAALTPAGAQFTAFLTGMRQDLKRAVEQGQMKENARQIPGIQVHDLFESRIYLIADRDDPLSARDLVTGEDLYGRTLMIGGGSPPALRAVQHRLTASGKINYFNSPDHDTTLTNVAAGRGICLAPGFLNDHSGQFAWIPFDCPERKKTKKAPSGALPWGAVCRKKPFAFIYSSFSKRPFSFYQSPSRKSLRLQGSAWPSTTVSAPRRLTFDLRALIFP